MEIEHGFSHGEAPSSITINIGQSEKIGQSQKKEAHVCIFDGCERGKRGYSDFCRKHKGMGKIIRSKIARDRSKIARDKGINVDPSVSMYEESLRVQESKLLPIQEPVHLKSPSHCKFSDCQNQRKGYSDFCREHKAIGKVIAGKIAREKAIAKIAERDNLGQVTETNPTDYSANIDYNSGIELGKDDSTFTANVLTFGLIGFAFFMFSSPNANDMVYFAACYALPLFCALVGAAIKEPITRLLVMAFLIPITAFLMFHIFLAMLFADLGSGGCFGVCGLSGWGGP